MNDQLRLDLDAITAYDEAISACEIEEIRVRLADFKGDHERHVTVLSESIRSHGGEPKVKRDVKGFFIQGFTKIVSHGDRSALIAMRANEELTNRSYESALKKELPEDVRLLLERNLSDEQRHLEWIKETIDQRAWERGEDRGETHAP
jgi:rubrerythrin